MNTDNAATRQAIVKQIAMLSMSEYDNLPAEWRRLHAEFGAVHPHRDESAEEARRRLYTAQKNNQERKLNEAL